MYMIILIMITDSGFFHGLLDYIYSWIIFCITKIIKEALHCKNSGGTYPLHKWVSPTF